MPYKDPQQKWEWERRHRAQRVARRRELREIEAARQAAQPQQPAVSGAAFMLPMIAGGVLAAHNPMLAIGAGGLTVFVAATYKKDWRWWVVGIVLLALAVFFLLNKKDENK